MATMATKHQEMLTLDGAKVAAAASEKKAKEIGVDMNIAVVDASTHLLHFSRMPNAKITSISSMCFHLYCVLCLFFFVKNFIYFLHISFMCSRPVISDESQYLRLSPQTIFHPFHIQIANLIINIT
jgi:hypothetical protein